MGLRKVQLSPMGGTKVPSRGAELGLHSIPHSKPLHPNMLESASANDKDTAFIMAWKELKEYSPCFTGETGVPEREPTCPKMGKKKNGCIFLNQLFILA